MLQKTFIFGMDKRMRSGFGKSTNNEITPRERLHKIIKIIDDGK